MRPGEGERRMFRKEIVEFLQQEPATASELAVRYECRPKEIEEELEHIRKSIRNENLVLEIVPARCRKCGFNFSTDKLAKPGKCPQCKGTWIEEPEFRIVRKGKGA